MSAFFCKFQKIGLYELSQCENPPYDTVEVRNVNEKNSFVSAKDEVCLQNALNAALLELKVSICEETQIPQTKDLIVYVDQENNNVFQKPKTIRLSLGSSLTISYDERR